VLAVCRLEYVPVDTLVALSCENAIDLVRVDRADDLLLGSASLLIGYIRGDFGRRKYPWCSRCSGGRSYSLGGTPNSLDTVKVFDHDRLTQLLQPQTPDRSAPLLLKERSARDNIECIRGSWRWLFRPVEEHAARV
jgi:hypothetical protein